MALENSDTGIHQRFAAKQAAGPSLPESLHVFTLFTFALSQPVFDILSQNPEFLIAHETSLSDLFVAILGPTLLAPLAVVGLEKLVGYFNENLRRRIHLLVIFCLLAAIFNPPLKTLPDSLDGLRALSALLLGAALALAYSRREPVRTFVTFLSPAILIFPLIFLSHRHIWEAVLHEPPAPDRRIGPTADPPTRSDVPVIVLVFDELPLTSLLDGERQIDAARYPHFAALGRNSTWYKNATTVSDNSTFAIPALLTGQYPDPEKIPIARHYPNTLFSLLGSSHEIRAFESATLLCPQHPQQRNRGGDQNPQARRLSLFFDTAIVYLRIVLPAKIAKHFPRASNTWEGFGDPYEWFFQRWLGELASDRLKTLERFLGSIEAPQAVPPLLFAHFLLPHSPFRFLPNGQRYRLPDDTGEVPEEVWDSEAQLVLSYYRHLLQLGFVDQLLGEIVSRLKQIELYDRALLCVVADHGISFRLKESPRRITETNATDILSVPLFLKAPGQTEGRIDEGPIELIDVLPTIAEMLQVKVNWKTDGRAASALRRGRASRKRVLRGFFRDWVWVTVEPEARDASLRRKIEWFGTGADENRIFMPTFRSPEIRQLISRIRRSFGDDVLPDDR